MKQGIAAQKKLDQAREKEENNPYKKTVVNPLDRVRTHMSIMPRYHSVLCDIVEVSWEVWCHLLYGLGDVVYDLLSFGLGWMACSCTYHCTSL